ncbi:MAG TPA: PmoA family protein [Pirellulales bacterium]
MVRYSASLMGWFVLAVAIAGHASRAGAAELSLSKHARGVRVEIDGQLFTEYLIATGPKPILWPVIGPTGAEMTRAFPMQQRDGEKHDHPHQRSVWFTHGDVNGIDFWSENGDHGSITHREYLQTSADDQRAVIATRNDWLDHQGKKVLEDERTLIFRADDQQRSIDFDIVLRATDGPVTFGDTKEGSMGVRIPTVMDLNSNQGGHIVTSEGLTDKAAWGKPASWVDYHGPLGGDLVGIAILNHPDSFRYPTRWHVRDYGLFAANPFGLKDFVGDPAVNHAYTLEPGKSLTLRYRIILHRGDEKNARIAEAFQKYAGE